MGIYRCSKCGSKNVDTDIRKEGYNIKKGFLGTFLFGTGGAVMGLNADEKKYYHCRDCGETRTWCMPVEHTILINDLLKNPIENKSALELQKKMYPNIEYEVINNVSNSLNVDYNALTKEELADIIYEYCKKHQIKEIEKDDLDNRIAGNWLSNSFDALGILEERDVAEYFKQR